MATPTPPDGATSQAIIASCFPASGDETYITHIKVLEDQVSSSGAPAEPKPRYILLASKAGGRARIHKSKRNSNGTFSIGKSWNLHDLRALEVLTPTCFNITLGKTYRWTTDRAGEQVFFLHEVVRTYRRCMGGSSPRLIGFHVPDESAPPPRISTPSPTPPLEPESFIPPPPSILAPAPAPAPAVSPPSPRPINQRPSSPPAPATAPVPARATPTPAPQALPPSSPAPSRAPSRAAAHAPTPSIIFSDGSGATASAYEDGPPPLRPPASSRSRTPAGTDSRSRTPISVVTSTSSPSSPPKRSHARMPSVPDPLASSRIISSTRAAAASDADDEDLTLVHVEEMLEGVEWRSLRASRRGSVASAASTTPAGEEIEARLTDELAALEAATIHSIINESDGRLLSLVSDLDRALASLVTMDGVLSAFRVQLHSVGEDIAYIESQSHGLQVQTSNQKALLGELERLLSTVHVDQDALLILTQESLESERGVANLEQAAATLYKALQAARDSAVGEAAASDRVDEYRTISGQFAKRLLDYLSIMFKFQAESLLTDKLRAITRDKPTILPHDQMENYLGRYCGLVLWLREMDEKRYQQLCASYFAAASDLHGKEMRSVLGVYKDLVRKATEEESEANFSAPPEAAQKSGAMKRAGTIVRGGPRDSKRDRRGEELPASEALSRALAQISPPIYREQAFLTDLLHVVDAPPTFAEYMDLETYFRRKAALAAAETSYGPLADVRNALDLIFGFLAPELQAWVDAALVKDQMQIVGILAAIERTMLDAQTRGQTFLHGMLDKQHRRLSLLLTRYITDQIKAIEQTKLTIKKRKGVSSFIRIFPAFVERIEAQLTDVPDSLAIRGTVNEAYGRIVQRMFELLQQMAREDGASAEAAAEDKEQLNYHVILVTNAFHFLNVLAPKRLRALEPFVAQAKELYDKNLDVYVKLLLRRHVAKQIDFFEGVERQLQSTPAGEVQLHATYNRAALKRVLKDFTAKDLRKACDALHKRVEKHYEASIDDEGGVAEALRVMDTVWKALEAEMLKVSENWARLLETCYSDVPDGLQYTLSDVKASFKRSAMA